MMYTLEELLAKMGAPETKEKGHMRWHYFNKENQEIAGYAEVRLTPEGLIAEVKQLHRDYEDDEGRKHETYVENLYMYAQKSGNRYKVTKIAFDGEEYAHPQKSVIELGLSVFHARALDISILMIEQAFNRQDILQPIVDERSQLRHVPVRKKESVSATSWGTVVPFRPRTAARVAL